MLLSAVQRMNIARLVYDNRPLVSHSHKTAMSLQLLHEDSRDKALPALENDDSQSSLINMGALLGL